MIVASIDIGSNTVLLLIAKLELDSQPFLIPIANYYRIPRISKEIDANGIIQDAAVNRLIDVLREYAIIIKNHKCEKVVVTGTFALRIAANSSAILQKVKELFGWDVIIISGDEEAKLSFLGAAFPFQNDKFINVIDIGGGSTEIICGNREKILYKKSFNIGVVTLTEKFIDKYTLKLDYYLMEEYVKNFLKLDSLKVFKSSAKTLAVAGTPTTLSAIKQNLRVHIESKIEGSTLTINDIISIVETLKDLTPKEIKNKFGEVVNGREDVLLTGAIILKSSMNLLRIQKIYVSTRGLRYGTIIKYFLGIDVTKVG
ncbi:hypothetical protein ABRY23_02490 [Melioribacteraceae bacterium 4301-Me]|uniref:Ppx/GppA phosphatase family protein n=1 Tax=Pyranulibacter aquaticus TaxID=3163344 RepID=UPI003594ACAA